MKLTDNTIPAIDLSKTTPEDFQRVMEVGMCQIKITDDQNILTAIEILRNKAKEFFLQSEEEKSKRLFKESKDDTGYINHKVNTQVHEAQQCYFKPSHPIPYFIDIQSSISLVSQYFIHEVAYSFLLQFMRYLKIEEVETKFAQIIEANGYQFSCNYYPKRQEDSLKHSLKPHKDFSMMAILNPDPEAGLEIFREGIWHPVNYKPGYLNVILGESLELCLGQNSLARVHRVKVPENERLCFGVFIDPARDKPIIDCVTGKTLFAQATDFFESRKEDYFSDYIEETRQKSELESDLFTTPSRRSPTTHRFSSPIHHKRDENPPKDQVTEYRDDCII